MKTTNLILIIPFLFWSCIENKSSKTEKETVANAITNYGVYAEDVLIYIVTDLILRGHYPTDSIVNERNDTLLIERVEDKNETVIRIRISEEFSLADTYYIGKKNKIVADFDEDGKNDIIIQVHSEHGASGTASNWFLFLNRDKGYEFTNQFDLNGLVFENTPKIKDAWNGRFNFEKVEGNILIGNSYYFTSGDAYCCPSIFATEKYKYNLKTNNFELVNQSKLEKKSYE
jgi:hypothetical protein